jgi:hypothetical protein
LTFLTFDRAGVGLRQYLGFKQFNLRSSGAALNVAGKQLDIQETQILGPHQKLHLVR